MVWSPGGRSKVKVQSLLKGRDFLHRCVTCARRVALLTNEGQCHSCQIKFSMADRSVAA